MARKKTTETAPEITPAAKIRQDIANLCTTIGDRSFVIRQAQSDITGFYTQIDQLREQLRVLETTSGSETAK